MNQLNTFDRLEFDNIYLELISLQQRQKEVLKKNNEINAHFLRQNHYLNEEILIIDMTEKLPIIDYQSFSSLKKKVKSLDQ